MQELNNFKYKDFLLAIIKGDRKGGYEIIKRYLANEIEIKELYEKLIKQSLYKLGELWERNKISVATEHMATAITESLLNSLLEYVVTEEKVGKTAIVACVENEYHELGLKMVSDIFEMNGWDTHFLGANVPSNELVKFAKIVNPDIFALSLSIYSNLPILEKMIIQIRKQFPDKLVMVGGQAFNNGGRVLFDKYQNVFYLESLSETELFIKKVVEIK
ncbi:MAG: cobalamin-dependent protein [Bacteroidales bacterium]|nr:cobalamin-dependent protein [Bacteroidales bacterium]